MAISPLHLDWPLLSAVGKPITADLVHDWFDDKPPKGEFLRNKKLAVAAWLDHHQRVTALGVFAKGVEKSAKSYANELPGGLVWMTTRTEARTKFGDPESSGDAGGTGIFALEFSWDRWQLDTGGFLRLEYTTDDTGLRAIQLQEPPLAEPTSITIDVYADYCQFYIADEGNTCDTDTLWDDPDSSKRQLAVGERLIAVGTKRYGTVPVTIEWYPIEPKLDARGIDRINECGLTITTSLGVGNYISVAELTKVPTIQPGKYGVRVLYLHQKQVVNDNEGSDEYRIQLWPVAELPGLRYIKPK